MDIFDDPFVLGHGDPVMGEEIQKEILSMALGSSRYP